jgi:DNA-binding MarR family transcriptional regulator
LNPYRSRIPAKPHLTIRQIVPWLGKSGPASASDLCARFRVTPGDAAVRLLKLWRWGYVRRQKSTEPPRVYLYRLSAFGERTAERWRKGG